MQRTLIWDLPTRLFHWTLALSFALSWLTVSDDRWRSIHVFLGYLILGLVGFRLIWGFAGSHFSRFKSFWFGPRAAFDYLKDVAGGRAARHVGHNPTGSVAIYLLLVLALLVGAAGVLTLGGDEQHGLAASWFTFEQIQGIKQFHKFGAYLMLMLVGVHICGVIVESVLHRENLAHSMVSGIKLAPPATPYAQPHRAVAILMLTLMLAFAGSWFYYAIDRQVDRQTLVPTRAAGLDTEAHVKFVGQQLPDNAQWRDECGSCHSVFYPALLPARSWQKLMATQDKHFGTDLGLDASTQQAVLKFLVDNAADGHKTEAAFKIDRSIPKDQTPLRITQTAYWLHKHREISSADWASPLVQSKNNCAACHSDANAGTFEDAAMEIPRPKPAASSASAAKP